MYFKDVMAHPALLTGWVPNHAPNPYKVASRKHVSCRGHRGMLGFVGTVRPRGSSKNRPGAEREVRRGKE